MDIILDFFRVRKDGVREALLSIRKEGRKEGVCWIEGRSVLGRRKECVGI